MQDRIRVTIDNGAAAMRFLAPDIKLAQGADAATVLQAESDEQIGVMGRLNQVEAVAANLQKRAPRFADPA